MYVKDFMVQSLLHFRIDVLLFFDNVLVYLNSNFDILHLQTMKTYYDDCLIVQMERKMM